MRSVLRRLVAASLLLLLLIQISPFTVSDPSSIVDGGDGLAVYIKPLQVCDSGLGRGGTIADRHWLPTLNVETYCTPTADLPLTPPTAPLSQGHPPRLLRPPRITPSL